MQGPCRFPVSGISDFRPPFPGQRGRPHADGESGFLAHCAIIAARLAGFLALHATPNVQNADSVAGFLALKGRGRGSPADVTPLRCGSCDWKGLL